ncbi:MAG TPA: MFS transporter [Propionicimonas sp.]|nr:MFS transporter [Propionicimonas sp.]HQA78776.1 MFS transporter [Propionicimonas sp.]HQD97379.1 MFS transporter [Propionicimonas sp.]
MRSTPAQRSWYWYDWANSAYITTTATVIIGPYLTSLANNAGCPQLAEGEICTNPVLLLGIFPVLPGALHPFLGTLSTIVSAILLLFVGAAADRSTKPHRWLATTAWMGALAGSLMFFLEGDNWQLGAWLMIIAAFCFGASTVVYDSILVRIAGPDERDKVSSRGWAFGYLGGGLLLLANFALMSLHEQLGISYGLAVRLSLLSAGLWWGLFTIIPVFGLRRLPREVSTPVARRNPFSQLMATFASMRNYPQTMLFLLAFLFFNDGIQTVIVSSSLYASSELGMATSQVMMTFLVTQFVAFGGALLFGRVAARIGAKRTVLGGIAIWLAVVLSAFLLPAGNFGALIGLGAAIGLVMGGTQALSRSMYSQLIPLGREAEYFSFYQAMERGTSWLGTLTFALVFQFSHSYRLALVALVVFFVVGGVLLTRVDMRKGITDAGNALPKVI